MKKGYVAIKAGGTKEHKQKRLALHDLSEVYVEFKK
jgi:hypothetical protein